MGSDPPSRNDQRTWVHGRNRREQAVGDSENANGAAGEAVSSEGSSLEVERLSVAYGPRRILADIGFRVPGRGITVLMGPSGTGKSTLLYLLSGLPAPARRSHSGSVRYLGTEAGDATRKPFFVRQKAEDLRSTLGALLAAPLREQLATALSPTELRAGIHNKLEQLGIPTLGDVLDRPVASLSSVELRLATLARAALSGSPLLLVDEPTSGLDPAGAASVLDVLQRLGREHACLVISHNQAHARQIADQAMLLAGGRIIVDAPTADFFGNTMQDPVLAQFLRTGSCSVPSLDTPPDALDVPPPTTPVVPTPRPAPAPAAAPPPPAPAPTAPPAPAAPAPAAEAAPVIAQHEAVARDAAPPAGDEPPAPLVPATSMLQPVPSAPPDSQGPNGFHWLIPGRLAGCPKPGVVHPVDHDLKLLKRMGITTLVNLTEYQFPPDALARHGLKGLALHIEDRKAPPLMWAKMLLTRMERLMLGGDVLAVHCLAGLGRTGTILCGWLVREGLTADEALRRVRALDPGFVQSVEQEVLLHELEANLLIRAD